MAGERASFGKQLLGFATGLAFGALLQRGRLSSRKVISQQLLMRDFRVVKTMASAIVVGAIGVHTLVRLGQATKDIKPMKVGGVLGGALLFGSGLALAGYCPGTSIAAAGEGKRDAMAVVAGMFVGAAAFIALYPRIAPFIDVGDLGKQTLPSLLHAPQLAPKPKTARLRISSEPASRVLQKHL